MTGPTNRWRPRAAETAAAEADVTETDSDDEELEELRLLTYASIRSAADRRTPTVDALLADIERVSVGAELRVAFEGAWDAEADLAPDAARRAGDAEAVSTQLLMRQACYRAASAAIERPVAESLLAFIA